MSVHSRYISGALAMYDGHRKSIVDAFGTDVIKYVDDFVHVPVDDTTGDPTAWTTTVVEAGTGDSTVTSANISGGGLLITTAANENDGANIQLNGESFKLASGNLLYFGARLKVSDATQSDLFAGLAITDTDILGGVTDRIGFQKLDGSTDLTFALEKDSTETLTSALHTVADDTYVKIEFFVDYSGSTANVAIFVDNVEQTAPAVTNLPDNEELRVSFHYLAGEAAAKTATIDWVRCIQFNRN